MSLIDADKQSDDRANPRLNVDDNVSNRMSHNTMGNSYRRTGGNVTQRMAFKNGLIITYDDDNKASSVYGYIPSVSSVPVFIIAQSGYDVFTDVLGITAPTT